MRDVDLSTDDVWVADSTPIECTRFRGGATLGAGVGWPSTGAVLRTASSFWVLRLHLVRTVLGASGLVYVDRREGQ